PAADYFEIGSDYIFEIGLTPNRGDAASHLGVARDLKALLERPLKLKEVAISETVTSDIVVELVSRDVIRYTGLTISGLKIGESPEWLKNKLKAIGLSPINNVVDATNYILHDLGQ